MERGEREAGWGKHGRRPPRRGTWGLMGAGFALELPLSLRPLRSGVARRFLQTLQRLAKAVTGPQIKPGFRALSLRFLRLDAPQGRAVDPSGLDHDDAGVDRQAAFTPLDLGDEVFRRNRAL